ncbi:CHAT domain-containing protein [Phlebopus sp. FC_14]|nr:CHAT domain-containing protein [Phlebopus sp. FC_14]
MSDNPPPLSSGDTSQLTAVTDDRPNISPIPNMLNSEGALQDAHTFDALIKLGDEQYELYEQRKDLTALVRAVKHYRAAFDSGPPPSLTPVAIQAFFRLYYALSLRAQLQGGDHNHELAEGYIKKAVSFFPVDHHLRPVILALQASSYSHRFKRTGELADLELTIQTYHDALSICPEDHQQRGHILVQYGLVLYSRYTKLRSAADLDLVVWHLQAALDVCADDIRVAARKSLAVAFGDRYKEKNDPEDLELAIKYYASVIDELQPGQFDHLVVSMAYAVALRERFRLKALVNDLDLAIRYFRAVIEGFPPGHQHHATALVFHAGLLVIRSEQRESLKDIDFSISYLRKAVQIRADGDPTRSSLLGTLGYALQARFIHTGNSADLEHAIEYCYDAVSSLSSVQGENRALSLNFLAMTLYTRYQLQGDRTDATKARKYFQEALDLCPPKHPDRPAVLNNFARLLGGVCRQQRGDLADLDLCIEYFSEALDICFEPSRSAILYNLATVLLDRFEKRGDFADLDLAEELCKAALELRPEGHPHRPTTFMIHGRCRVARLTAAYSLADVEVALDLLNAAQSGFPPGHPLLIVTYRELSSTYLCRYSISKTNSDLEEAFDYQRKAADHSSGGSNTQFQTALRWVEDAEKFNHPSSLLAYRTAIRLLDMHLVLKPSADLRHDIIKKDALSVCADATSCALRHNDVENAVEMFEQSRGLFWTHMARLRTVLDDLRGTSEHHELASEFENLSKQLAAHVHLDDDGEQGQRYRRLQREWNDIVDKIRAIQGFERFLLPPRYSDLQVAAIEGPVIILNASRYSCDAIIVLAHGTPVHVPFPDNTFSKILAVSTEFQRLMRLLRRSDESGLKQLGRQLRDVLHHLWDAVVRDVVDHLKPHVPKNSRIWWCPTGKFTSLPLHAAGPYSKGEPNLSDIYVSSYTPTLSALIRSRNKRNGSQKVPQTLICIGQPEASGYPTLQTVHEELDLLSTLLPPSVEVTRLTNESATREAALAALKTHTLAHLACHGMQEHGRPFNSRFAMHDGPLSLVDIIQTDSGHQTEFAFLSACQTATGDRDAPDEVIHLAAALQFSGVRSVLGTMWSVHDSVVLHFVSAFYRAMVNDDGEFDPSRAARALRTATRRIKDKVPFDQRIVFIHIGA